jgi:hypothetical protein
MAVERNLRNLHWSPSEKKIARTAFDSALAREKAATRMAVEEILKRSDDLDQIWDIHDFLSDKRREFRGKYDYRYSVLIWVFGRLLHEQWLIESDLTGLATDKLELIRDRAAALGKLTGRGDR